MAASSITEFGPLMSCRRHRPAYPNKGCRLMSNGNGLVREYTLLVPVTGPVSELGQICCGVSPTVPFGFCGVRQSVTQTFSLSGAITCFPDGYCSTYG